MTDNLGYWNRQFQFQAILPDFQTWLDWFAAETAAYAESLTFERLAYGSHPRQWLEVTGEGDGPVLPVFIHGGYWRAQQAEAHRAVLGGLAQIGPVRANVEYRLMPEARLDDLVNDVADALRLLAGRTKARLFVTGHSAGGHLAVAGARRAGLGDRIAGVAPISGIFDLEPIRWSFLQAEIGLTEAEVASSPLRADPSGDPPMLIALGDDETPEYHRQAEALAAVADAPVLRVKGAHHMSVLASLTGPEAPIAKVFSAFLAGQASPPMIEARVI